ncbi:hypothetical protein AB0I68_16785 [Streptomyces sp. NPDC050448]|uniref:hypothetical protein n=1 Tax=Streptomyces sp. NPDC050448 TaxID=3155404 RepID=UPI003445B0D6
MFIGGPLLVLALHTLTGTTVVLIATAAIVFAGCALLLTAPPTRTWKPSCTRTHSLGPIRTPGLRALAAALFGAGITLGALNVVALAAAERHHAEYLSTMMPAALAVGSPIGGFLYGRRTWPGSPTRQLRAIGCGFAVGSLPTLADPAPALAITAAVLPGLFPAPRLVTGFHTLDFLVPRLLSLRRRPGSSPLRAWDRPLGSHSRGSCRRPLLPRQPQVLPPAGPQPGSSCSGPHAATSSLLPTALRWRPLNPNVR